MGTYTIADFLAATTPYPVDEDVIITGAGNAFDGLTPADLARFAAFNVDSIDASNDSMFLSTSQFEALGSVRLTAADTVVLADTGANSPLGHLRRSRRWLLVTWTGST